MAGLNIKRTRTAKVHMPTVWDLMDREAPEYIEYKEGSTDQGATVLIVRPLTDGRFVWQTSYRRERYDDGTRCDWRIGFSNMGHNTVCATFEEALDRARAELDIVPLPKWIDNNAGLAIVAIPEIRV